MASSQWKDVDTVPLARAMVLPSRVKKQQKETSLWGFTDLGTSPEENRAGKGRMSIRVSDLTTDIWGWKIRCWGDEHQDSLRHHKKCNSIPGLYTLDPGSTPTLIMTTKTVSIYHQCFRGFVGGGGCLLVAEDVAELTRLRTTDADCLVKNWTETFRQSPFQES